MEEEQVRIEVGPSCPPIQSWFFPLDPEKKPYPLEDEEDKSESSAQPA